MELTIALFVKTQSYENIDFLKIVRSQFSPFNPQFGIWGSRGIPVELAWQCCVASTL